MPSPERDPFKLAGATIDGKYRVISVVGEGGFGVVYRGVHEGFDAPVAVKCLKLPPHFDKRAQDDLIQKLREEGRLLRRLSQRTPGIVQAHDVGSFTTPDGARVPYLVLEWLEGRTLAEEIRARRDQGAPGLSLAEAVALLDPAARALAVAHEEKIAHRDIKPENLFVVSAGGRRTLKVLDFGIAKILADAPAPGDAVTAAGPTMFTPGYGAPEQFDKQRGASGPWTDVFALALVLIELVTFRPGLEGNTLAELYLASTDAAHRPTLRGRGADAKDAVDRVLERALAVDPRDRYPDVGAFWEALSAALAGVSEAASHPATDEIGQLSTAEFAASTGLLLPRADHPTALADTTLAPAPPPEPKTTTKAAAVSAPSPVAPRPALSTRALLGALAVAAAAGVAFLWTHRAPPASPPTASPSAASAAPASKNPEADSLYRDAMQAWHDGALEVAVDSMERTLAIDRTLGAAELRLALWKFERKPAQGREHFQSARLHRASLREKDALLLSASEAYLQEPWDLPEWTRRLEALVDKYPDDEELRVYLGLSLHAQLKLDAAIASFDHALGVDPGLVAAWVLKAESLALKGDLDGQLKACHACLEQAPMALPCLSKQIQLREQLGACEAMREDAKRLLSLTPTSAFAERRLAVALYAAGDPRPSVLEALGRSFTLLPENDRKGRELEDNAALATLDGDFEGAARDLAGWIAAVANKTDQNTHADPALSLAKVYQEMGLPRKAAEVADDFVRRMGAWSEPPSGDWSMSFAPFRLRAGLISADDYARARAAWAERVRGKWKAAGRRLDQDLDWIAWSSMYGSAVETEAEAKAAVAAMPSQRSPLVDSGRWATVDLNMGRAYVLAGEAAPAVVPLRRALKSCVALSEPLIPVIAELYLGMALEGTGDMEGAKAAYGHVLARWGKAKPRSVTAEAAKKRLAALGKKR